MTNRRIAPSSVSREVAIQYLHWMLEAYPIIYMGSPIHADIEELSQITGIKVTYYDYKRTDLNSGDVIELAKNGRMKRTVVETAKPPAPVIEFKKKRSNKGDFTSDIKRNPTAGPSMFDLNEFTGAEVDVISESRR